MGAFRWHLGFVDVQEGITTIIWPYILIYIVMWPGLTHGLTHGIIHSLTDSCTYTHPALSRPVNAVVLKYRSRIWGANRFFSHKLVCLINFINTSYNEMGRVDTCDKHA